MKDFNLVKFLKANKLGSYSMINENYVDLHAVNNYSEQHPIHNVSEDFDSNEDIEDEDDDMEFVAQMKKRNRGGDEMDAVSRAEGIVDEKNLERFRMLAMALIGDMENDGFETDEAIDVLKQIIDGQFSNASNSDLNEDDSATIDQYLDMISKDHQFDKKGNNYTGMLNVDPSDSGKFTDIATSIAKNPKKYTSKLDSYGLSIDPGASEEEMVFSLKKKVNESSADTRNFSKYDIEHSGVPVGQPSPKAVVGQEFIEHLSDTMTRTSRSGSGYGDKYKVVADNGNGMFACEKIS